MIEEPVYEAGILDGLSDSEAEVAVWAATPKITLTADNSTERRESADVLAERLGLTRSTIYRIAARDSVREVTTALRYAALGGERLADLWEALINKGVENSDVGERVAFKLLERGIHPFAASGTAIVPAGASPEGGILTGRPTAYERTIHEKGITQ